MPRIGMEEIVTCADVYWANSGCCVEPPCGQLNPTSDLMCDDSHGRAFPPPPRKTLFSDSTWRCVDVPARLTD
jgi:hypothetical protein